MSDMKKCKICEKETIRRLFGVYVCRACQKGISDQATKDKINKRNILFQMFPNDCTKMKRDTRRF